MQLDWFRVQNFYQQYFKFTLLCSVSSVNFIISFFNNVFFSLCLADGQWCGLQSQVLSAGDTGMF